MNGPTGTRRFAAGGSGVRLGTIGDGYMHQPSDLPAHHAQKVSGLFLLSGVVEFVSMRLHTFTDFGKCDWWQAAAIGTASCAWVVGQRGLCSDDDREAFFGACEVDKLAASFAPRTSQLATWQRFLDSWPGQHMPMLLVEVDDIACVDSLLKVANNSNYIHAVK